MNSYLRESEFLLLTSDREAFGATDEKNFNDNTIIKATESASRLIDLLTRRKFFVDRKSEIISIDYSNRDRILVNDLLAVEQLSFDDDEREHTYPFVWSDFDSERSTDVDGNAGTGYYQKIENTSRGGGSSFGSLVPIGVDGSPEYFRWGTSICKLDGYFGFDYQTEVLGRLYDCNSITDNDDGTHTITMIDTYSEGEGIKFDVEVGDTIIIGDGTLEGSEACYVEEVTDKVKRMPDTTDNYDRATDTTGNRASKQTDEVMPHTVQLQEGDTADDLVDNVVIVQSSDFDD